ncbi:Fc.00g068290.m01.CDS01 [Cosmosporella sp. VM-42]
MPDSVDTFGTFQSKLDPYIKPREHVNYIRRILALHLGSCSRDGPIKQPSSLVDSSHDITLGSELKGVQREFIEALKANVAAQRQYDDVVQANSSQPPTQQVPSSDTNLLEERISLLKLQSKQERLSAVQQYFNILVEKPAASQGFLDQDDIFQGRTSLPNVPKEVVNSLVALQSSAKPDLKGQVAQLEKTVLRTKLLLRREEQLLQETRAQARDMPDVVSNGTRLDALNATRNELINWIETELSKASGDDEIEDRAEGGRGHDKSNVDKAAINRQLSSIKDKYARYLEARKSLLSTIAERVDVSLPPLLKPLDTAQQTEDTSPIPSSYLLTPYIETLLSVSRKQKSMITQKSHTNSFLNKQTKSDYRSLGALAEESHLLPAYPMQKSRRKSVLGDVLTAPTSEPSGFTSRVQPWVFAADSAKLATFEIVAEKVEGGQVALESSMNALQEIDHLLGQDQVDQAEEVQEEQPENDFWLDNGAKHPASARKHTERKDMPNKPKDAWSGIHGNLGLIGHKDLV